MSGQEVGGSRSPTPFTTDVIRSFSAAHPEAAQPATFEAPDHRYARLPLSWFRITDQLARRADRHARSVASARIAAARRGLLALEMARHVALLETELTAAALFGGDFRPWPAAYLPRWCGDFIGPEQLRVLGDQARSLDAALAGNRVCAPLCTLEEILRLAVLRSFADACRAQQLPHDVEGVEQLLGCGQVLARYLWHEQAARDCKDVALLHARGHERLLPQLWTRPVGSPARSGPASVTFDRRRPLRPDEPQPGARCEVTTWGPPVGSATSAADRQVWLSRRAARRRGEGWVPTGEARDLAHLEVLCGHRLQRRVVLRCYLHPARSRIVEALLVGLEVDERGRAHLLLGWEASLLALPLGWLVSVRDYRARPVT
ncbi:MAG: hypothetical protein ACXVGA_04380 [Mycobacteriaceae bacterium]